MVNRFFLSLVLLLTLSTCDGCFRGPPPPSLAGTLRLGGSTTVYPLAQAAAGAFQRLHPAVRVEVSQSSTGEGLRAFLDGALDIANATRPPTEKEMLEASRRGKSLYLTVVAYDAVVVLVNAENPMTGLRARDLKGIFFSGAISHWEQLLAHGEKKGPLHVYHTNSDVSGTAELFEHVVMAQHATPYVSGSTEVHPTPDVAARVKSDPDAIAYSPLKWVGPGVKVLPIDGVAPREVACLDGSYPFCRRLLFITNGPPSGLAREYVSFVLSVTYQQTIVRQQGFIPII